MIRSRFVCLLTALMLVIGAAATAEAAEVDCDSVYCFTHQDFSGENPVTGVCITGLPAGHTGTVKLGQRIIRPGDILTAHQLPLLTFNPVPTKTDQQAVLTYLPIRQTHVGQQAQLTLSIRGKQDNPPAAEDMALETYKNLPLDGHLKAADPENQPLTCTITRQPKRGAVALQEDGSFTYTPKKNKVGTDSFTYTAADPAGHVSREATVTVQILKPTDDSRYADTQDSTCRFTAEWMKNTGIFSGEQVGGSLCFNPDRPVTRGEFLAMVMNTLHLDADQSARMTGFADEAPGWLRPYLAAAMRQGMVSGYPRPEGPVFLGDQLITGAEAASMVKCAMDLPVPVASMDSSLPVWAAGALGAVQQFGIAMTDSDTLTRADAANILYQVSSLIRQEAQTPDLAQ